ncbi:hypothetical protein HNR42_000359 [Deinobacterium chartae]|uniref:Calcineurin-like phosphoesterase domain-containing protein n=1 Tax=Deinobacterium chartae TaxID=521158 RepID=A0A841HUC0_9DEIO|nr:metallophosphoesterase [Deinobacterium chartae]MBB6096947.1 hypothetical protein [Deinobacterium chartae]
MRRLHLAPSLLAAATLTGLMVYNSYRPRITRHRLSLPGLRAPLRLVQLSDLHYGLFLREGSLRAWVERALQLEPDAVVITGDLLDQSGHQNPAPLLRALRRLRPPLGVWGVWGNHDRTRCGPQLEAFGQELAASGVRMLVNCGAALRDDLYLAGVDDLWTGRPDLEAALKDRPPKAACVLLCHHPDLLPQLPARIGLTLCGHTHGGQIQLPLLGAVYTGSAWGQRYLGGWVPARSPAYVSRGLGTSGLPLRWNCPPEIAVFELLPRSP